MIKIKVRNGAVGYVRGQIPAGIEWREFAAQGQIFLKVRTSDPEVISRLKAAAL